MKTREEQALRRQLATRVRRRTATKAERAQHRKLGGKVKPETDFEEALRLAKDRLRKQSKTAEEKAMILAKSKAREAAKSPAERKLQKDIKSLRTKLVHNHFQRKFLEEGDEVEKLKQEELLSLKKQLPKSCRRRSTHSWKFESEELEEKRLEKDRKRKARQMAQETVEQWADRLECQRKRNKASAGQRKKPTGARNWSQISRFCGSCTAHKDKNNLWKRKQATFRSIGRSFGNKSTIQEMMEKDGVCWPKDGVQLLQHPPGRDGQNLEPNSVNDGLVATPSAPGAMRTETLTVDVRGCDWPQVEFEIKHLMHCCWRSSKCFLHVLHGADEPLELKIHSWLGSQKNVRSFGAAEIKDGGSIFTRVEINNIAPAMKWSERQKS